MDFVKQAVAEIVKQLPTSVAFSVPTTIIACASCGHDLHSAVMSVAHRTAYQGQENQALAEPVLLLRCAACYKFNRRPSWMDQGA